jgi:hypothetical protein
MKIKLWDRLIVFFGAVLVILAGAALFVAGLQIQGMLENLPLAVRVLCIVCGLLLAAFGGYLIVLPRRYAAKRHDFVVQRTDNGELRIAVKAIENLVQKCIDLHEEIQVSSMNILNSREGVVVDLCVSMANNISIPLAIASLQKQIKQYLIASSGIEVKEVRVSVESTQDVPTPAIPAENAEQLSPAKEKRPLHERLFGTPDQPAIVPEPPKEEEESGEETPQEQPEEEKAEEDSQPSVNEAAPAEETAKDGKEALAEAEAADGEAAQEDEDGETETAPEAEEQEHE